MPFYAVARGHTVGIYKSWDECERMVKGFKGARYKKFDNHEAAQIFVDEHKTVSLNSVTSQMVFSSNYFPPSTSSDKLTKFKVDIIDKNKAAGKKRKHEDVAEKNHSLTDVRPVRPCLVEQHKAKSGRNNIPDMELANIPVVYTDGACGNNQRRGGSNTAKAGYGVFWGDGHPDNVSEPLEGTATNNRAEYTAVIVALQQAIRNNFPQIIIRTDSMLLINSLTVWRNTWKRNNWRKKDGTTVLNLDLLKQLDSLLGDIQVTFEHVKAHIGIHGNEMADELARQGAILYKGNC